MRRSVILKVFLFLLMVGTGVVCASCSSDDDDVVSPTASCYCGGEIIRTIHDRGGIMIYSKELGRWYIQCRYHQVIEYYEEYYCSENLDDKYKKEGLPVLFSGDLYDINIDGEVNTVEENKYLELTRYCIDLISIENYPNSK